MSVLCHQRTCINEGLNQLIGAEAADQLAYPWSILEHEL